MEIDLIPANFSDGQDLSSLFPSEKRLEEIEHAINEWNLVVDYDPEPDQETLDLQKSLGESLRRWKAEVLLDK